MNNEIEIYIKKYSLLTKEQIDVAISNLDIPTCIVHAIGYESSENGDRIKYLLYLTSNKQIMLKKYVNDCYSTNCTDKHIKENGYISYADFRFDIEFKDAKEMGKISKSNNPTHESEKYEIYAKIVEAANKGLFYIQLSEIFYLERETKDFLLDLNYKIIDDLPNRKITIHW